MKKISLFILSLLAVFISSLAQAHFHYELPIKTMLSVNTKEELSGLDITWVYDDELTKLMLKDQKDVTKLGKKLMKDLSMLGYFTFLKLNGKELSTSKVTEYKLEEIKYTDYKNLKLSFHLPLKKPVSLAGKNSLEFRHEDANASAVLYYDKPEHLQIGKALEMHCEVVIKDKKDFEEGEAPQTVKVACK